MTELENLKRHNKALRDNFDSVWAIKQSIAADNIIDAIMYVNELPEQVIRALWLSPRNGGIFTTEERRIMKSDEWAKIRRGEIECK